MNLRGSDFKTGKIIEMVKGDPGAWTEPATPPNYTVEVVEIFLTFSSGERYEIGIGDEVEFTVDDDGGDHDWPGKGRGVIDFIRPDRDGGIPVILKNGEITYTGPTPLQSQAGRE
ncbi:MAG: hypothetical protein V3V24_09790 [Nitrospinaceae bacterium]